MPWWDNPGFGSYTDEEYSDALPSTPSFGVKASQKADNGFWCPRCLNVNFYSWIDYSGARCPEHGRVLRGDGAYEKENSKKSVGE